MASSGGVADVGSIVVTLPAIVVLVVISRGAEVTGGARVVTKVGVCNI